MHETIRMKRSFRNLMLACLLFFLIIEALSVYAFLFEAKGPHRWIGALVTGGFWSCWIVVCLWALLAYWKNRLIIEDDQITKVGIFTTKELRIGDVTEASWSLRPVGGSVLFVTPGVRMKLDFNEYTTEQRDALVRHLRAELDPDVQSGWTLFAYRITTGEPKVDEPQPGDSRITRGRCDQLFFCLMPAGLVIGCLTYWMTGLWKHLYGPFVLLIPLWLLFRFMIPKQGILDRPITLDRSSDGDAAMKRLALVGVVCLAVMFWANHRFGDSTIGIVIMIFASVVFYAFISVEIVKKERRFRLLTEQAAEAAAIVRGEASEHWQ